MRGRRTGMHKRWKMERFTKKADGARCTVEPALCEAALYRLMQYEDAYEKLLARREQSAAELERLRSEGKEKTARYKELLGQKLIDNSICDFFKQNGIG